MNDFNPTTKEKMSDEEKPTKAEDESFLKAAGSWKGLIDAEGMINNIYANRHLSTRPKVKERST